jgi:hypothetical protein
LEKNEAALALENKDPAASRTAIPKVFWVAAEDESQG